MSFARISFNRAMNLAQWLAACAAAASSTIPIDVAHRSGPLTPLAAAAEQCTFVSPPMGWNSYDSTIGNGGINETIAKSSALFVSEKLAEFGYEYIVLDSGWFGSDSDYGAQVVDEWGRLIPKTSNYPSSANGAGLKPIADYVHSLGLKFGFWIMGGIPREAVIRKLPVEGTNYTVDQIADTTNSSNCPWNKWLVYGSKTVNGRIHPGAAAYYDSIARLYRSWGADFIKMDCVFGNNYYRGKIEMEQFALSLRNTQEEGHQVLLSLSPGQNTSYATVGANFAGECTKGSAPAVSAVMARMTGDFWDHWGELYSHFDTAAQAAPFVSQHFFPDLDMLPIGWLRHIGTPRYSSFSATEQRTLVTQWVIARAPLFWGGAASADKANATTMGLIANADVLAVAKHSCGNRQLRREGNVTVWAAAGKGENQKYVAFFNLGDTPQNVQLKLDDSAIPGAALPTPARAGAYKARDLWHKSEQLIERGTVSQELQPHASTLLLVYPAASSPA